MKATAFAVFCVLALAGAQALSQADVDNFLETSELQALENNNRALLLDGTPGLYGTYGQEKTVATATVGTSPPSCATGKSVAYTTSATKLCVLSEFKSSTGTVYNAYNGRIADSTGVTCYATACAAGAATAATATAAAATAPAATAVAVPAATTTAVTLPAAVAPTLTVPTVTVPTITVPTVTVPTFSIPTINLSSLFGKGRRLMGAQFFWPFGPHPFAAATPAATATTTTVVTNVTGRKISYFAAQCYTVCE